MKKILILFIGLITTLTCAQTEEPFPYQREWVTASLFDIPNTSSLTFFPNEASLHLASNYNIKYDDLVKEDTEFKQRIIEKISPNQELDFIFPFGNNYTSTFFWTAYDKNDFFLFE